jgi:hypothetical protein
MMLAFGMRWIVCLSFWVLLQTSLAARAEDSVYTPLDLSACQTLESFGDGGRYRCPGLDGLPVFVSEGDLRFDVDYGTANESFDGFGAFNDIGKTIEWRLRGGKPFAAILRYSLDIAGEDGEMRKGSVLQVSKIGTEGRPGCAVAYVDAVANKNANGLARDTADGAVRGFRCGTDTPFYAGRTGPLSGQASGTE